MDDFSKYQSMRDAGATANEVYAKAKSDHMDSITTIRMLREIFGLSLSEVKEVMVIVDGRAASSEAYQEGFIADIEEAIRQEDEK